MKKKTILIVLVTSLLLVGALMTAGRGVSLPWGSPVASIVIESPELEHVSLVSFDSARVDPKFIDLFEKLGEDWAYFRPYIAVVSNQSSRSVQALTMEWLVTDEQGKEKAIYANWNTYFSSLFPNSLASMAKLGVVDTHSQTLVWPTVCSPTVICTGLGSLHVRLLDRAQVNLNQIRVPEKPQLAELSRSRRIKVSLDTVIFEDGYAWGPNRSRTLEHLEARHAAAYALVQRAREAAASGTDLATLLSKLASSTASPESDPFGFYLANQARNLQNASAPRQSIENLSKLPRLPMFVRSK